MTVLRLNGSIVSFTITGCFIHTSISDFGCLSFKSFPFWLRFLADSSVVGQNSIKMILKPQPSPIESLCGMSIQKDLTWFFHQPPQDHMLNPPQIQRAWTSSAEMASTQLPWALSVSLPPQSYSPPQPNEFHLWARENNWLYSHSTVHWLVYVISDKCHYREWQMNNNCTKVTTYYSTLLGKKRKKTAQNSS